MKRRSFFGTLFGGLAVAVGVKAAEAPRPVLSISHLDYPIRLVTHSAAVGTNAEYYRSAIRAGIIQDLSHLPAWGGGR